MTTSQGPSATASPARSYAILFVPSYRPLWLTSWTWNTARWVAFFAASYIVYAQSGSTFLTQLVGTAFYGPIFIGGIAGGVIADRVDRRRMLIVLFGFFILVSCGLSVAGFHGVLRPWQLYLAMVVFGVGFVSDLTARRTLIADIAGPELMRSAFAMEAMSSTGSALLGNLFGGLAIALGGPGAAFAVVGVLCVVGAAAQARVPARPVTSPRNGARAARDLVDGVRFVATSPALLGVIAVTIVMEFFFYTYAPLVPVFAKHMGVNAFWAGVLGSAVGFGSLISAFLLAGRYVRLPGVNLYVGGAALGLIGVLVFAVCRIYPIALLGLTVAGFGSAGFASMQVPLVVTAAPVALHGRIMGIMGMAIGVLPFTLIALGLIAQRTGPVLALSASNVIGLVMLGVVWSLGRAMRRLNVHGSRSTPVEQVLD